MTGVEFRRRLTGGAPLIGTFVKTPAPHVVEILGAARFDFVVIDAEHAPFDRAAIDAALLAARAVGIAAIVRPALASSEYLLAALDDGAAGVLAPHIDSVDAARRLVGACRYSGGRGFSNSPRAGDYGERAIWDHVDASDATTSVIAMIEDKAAVDAIEDIVAVEGIDALFVGRADLAVSTGDRETAAAYVAEATGRVIAAARGAGKPVMLFVADVEEARRFQAQGVSAFILSSDQGLMKSAARAAVSAFGGLTE